ncbi:MAG: undecaprenyl-phosphate glucose phosphotransferase [Calditrichaeota bacterium]|nr:MAG: undecaprenyl-phosphate glucose phosphotransferase [Calditrichota bacterium]
MLRENSNYLKSLWRLLDLSLFACCFIASYHIRFALFPLTAGMEKVPPLALYVPNLVLLLVLWIFVAQVFGLYASKRIQTRWTDWRTLAMTLIFTLFLYTSVGFLFKSFDVSRLLLIIFTPLSYLVLGVWHHLFRSFLADARIRGYNKRNLLIIGAGATARRFAYEITSHRETGYQVVGFLDDKVVQIPESPIPILGKLAEISAILESQMIDRVVVALGMNESRHLAKVVRECEYAGIEVNIIPDLFQFIHPRAKVLNLNGIPLIGVRPNPVDTWQYVFLKRLFDIAFSLLILTLISPLALMIILLIKLTSRGPIFFIQERLGTQGRPFNFFKFRTMTFQTTAESDTRWTRPNDDRVTLIGKFLRRTSLDELPQFWNILKGDMSVVGPRPERPYFAQKFRKNIPEYMIRHQVKTGLTGWAQVNGLRGDTSIEKRIQFDLYYIENWSFSFDMRIILLTFYKGLLNKNAY